MYLNICHLMPHLGGGVGKAMTTLVKSTFNHCISHVFILFEFPEKRQFYEKLKNLGCRIYVKPDRKKIVNLIQNSDIVQLEWWNHPATFQFLCNQNFPQMRLLIWSHVSGLYFPLIPRKLFSISDIFLFTSECSYKSPFVNNICKIYKDKIDVVSSGTGITSKDYIRHSNNTTPRFGYMGSLNPSKLNPNFINYLTSVKMDKFKVHIWSDNTYHEKLIDQCIKINRHDLIKFYGYTNTPENTLQYLDVFIYLLNQTHYGTAENVLLEAMSMGAVPIVMNNPAETAIVDHELNGFIVNSKHEFAKTVYRIFKNPKYLNNISKNAVNKISKNYTMHKMSYDMRKQYNKIMNFSKKKIDFSYALGKAPYEWYMSCQDIDSFYEAKEKIIYNQDEDTKGSIKHYIKYFPYDIKLKSLADRISYNI